MAADSTTSAYDASTHYLGDQGKKYLGYLTPDAETIGELLDYAFGPYVQPDDVVLDFGAGTGQLLHHLACRKKIAVEVNEAARQTYSLRYGEEIEAHADLAEIPDGAIDLCISNHCLEHVPFPIAAIKEIRRTLKAGGRFVLRVPLDDWRTQKRYDPSDANHHLHTWTPLSLGHTLHEAGFQQFQVSIDTHAWPPKFATLYRVLPKPLFHSLCRVFSALVKRRQLLAVCDK